jgi:hypothetical protein
MMDAIYQDLVAERGDVVADVRAEAQRILERLEREMQGIASPSTMTSLWFGSSAAGGEHEQGE